MLRYSLITLLAAILLISLGCAALVSASELWVQVVVTATILALLVATIGAFYLPRTARAFAGGFAICGWVYLLLVQGPWLESLKPRLLTTLAVNRLQAIMHDDIGGGDPNGASVATALAWIARRPASADSANTALALTALGMSPAATSISSAFQQIGHLLWTILLACFGGVVARYFSGWRRPRTDTRSTA